jgi:hypothetical protein
MEIDDINENRYETENPPVSQKELIMQSLETPIRASDPDEDDEATNDDNTTASISLELGDILEIVAPTNPDIHETTVLITYIDAIKIKTVNIATGGFHQLNIQSDGTLTDESIVQFILLDRSKEAGYARQNGLLPGVWADIHFGGEIPAILTGEITNLEEDQIEFTTFPELRVLFIDFAYQGIPEQLPIEHIILREKPLSLGKIESLHELSSEEDMEIISPPSVKDFASMEQTPTGETILTIPEEVQLDENIRDSLHHLYIDAHSIVFGERLPEIAHLVEIPESQQRYSIDDQTNSLLDELLSTVPTSQRTKNVLDTMHTLIARFKELRETYSLFDINTNIHGTKVYGPFYKPLAQQLLTMDVPLSWILPVVKNRRKLYDVEGIIGDEDILSENLAPRLSEIEKRQPHYSGFNAEMKDNLSYSELDALIQSFFQPVEPQTDAFFLSKLPVVTDTTCLVNNLGDFYSTAFAYPDENAIYRRPNANEGLIKRRFLIQPYITGSTHLQEVVSHSGKKNYIRQPMTSNETMNITSLLFLPAPIAKYSTLYLPGTPLIEAAGLHQTPFYLSRLFRRDLDITSYEITDLSKEFKQENYNESMNLIREYTVDNSLLTENDLWEQFVNVIVPKTRDLLKQQQLHLQPSLYALVNRLRPFMVYQEHITFQCYKDIRFYIKQHILEIKKTLDEQLNEGILLRNAKYAVESKPNPVMRLLSEKQEFAELFLQGYSLRATLPESSTEILSRIYAADDAQLFTTFITSILITVLNTPQHLLDGLTPPEIDDISRLEKVKATDSAVRFLAKRYDSIRALQKDNNNDDLFYDKDFDATPYEIMDLYRDEQKNMSPDLFLAFLEENLIQKHQVLPAFAKSLASTLVAKKKRVENGDYAIVEIVPHLPEEENAASLTASQMESIELEAQARKKTEYYQRRKGIWVNDPNIGHEAFLDNAALFANINATFFKKGEKEACDDVNHVARQKQLMKKNLTNELEKRVTIYAEDLTKELERNVDYYLRRIRRVLDIKEIQATRANRLAFALGSYANTADLVQSPHLALRDLIFGQDDFSKKQFDICQFVDKFCREPMVAERNEDFFWFYCKDSNTKLFPCSLHQLALVFISGGDYAVELDKVSREVGILGDDGYAIVDRHTGYTLRKIDFVTEEGFTEEGFRITTHDILEKDVTSILQEAKKSHPVFENEVSQTIYNVAFTLCEHIDIPIAAVESFVMRFAIELLEKHVAKEEAYERRSAKQEKEKGKRLPPFEKYREETMVYILAGVLLVAIQTATPSFRTRKTFPGCVRSFSGYPLNGGIEDLTAITYMACVISKTATSNTISPWKSVKGIKSDALTKRIQDALENYLLKRSDIEQLYAQKREYMLLHSDMIVPEEHSISKWLSFLPPVVPIHVLSILRPVSADFRDDLLHLLSEGKRDQFQSLCVLSSKIVQYGYAAIELIHHIVQSKQPLLKTSSNVPFLENACCHEVTASLSIPFLYFNQEDARLAEYIKHVNVIHRLSSFVQDISIAPLFYHIPFSGIVFPSLPAAPLEETLYAAIIYYCHLDHEDRPIPTAFLGICSEKPVDYVNTWSLLDKIEFLKRHGKRYTIDTLYQLMRIVNDQNRVIVEVPRPFIETDPFREIINHFDLIQSGLVGEQLRHKIRAVLDNYQPKQRVSVDSPETEDLQRYLLMANRQMFQRIMSFFDTHGNLSTSKYNKMANFLQNLCDWPTSEKEEGHLCRVAQYVKNLVYLFTKVYPAVLQSKEGFYSKIPKHWGLSNIHESILAKIFSKYFAGIEGFKMDRVLQDLLENIHHKIGDIHLFLNHLPIQTEWQKTVETKDGKTENRTFYGLFNHSTIYALLKFSFYSVLYEYIVGTEDEDISRADVQEFKRNSRAKNAAMADESNLLQSLPESAETEEIEMQEVDFQQVRIREGSQLEWKDRVCSLLLTCLGTDVDEMEMMHMSYRDMISRVNRSKEREKRGIIENFGKMSIEQRRIENMYKNFRMGRWNVGQQRGLIDYDKDTFDREIREMKMDLLTNAENGREDMVTEMMRDIVDVEREEGEQADREGDQEAYNIQDLGENYMDGEYYPEDHDDDFRED